MNYCTYDFVYFDDVSYVVVHINFVETVGLTAITLAVSIGISVKQRSGVCLSVPSFLSNVNSVPFLCTFRPFSPGQPLPIVALLLSVFAC